MAKPILGMIPPGGWHYYQSDVRLTGHSYENLIANLEAYRAENHLESSDAEGDINSYICSNWPHFCHGVDMVSVTSVNVQSASMDLLNDIQMWAKNILHSQKPHPLVTDELAEERAKTCAACKFNTTWQSACGACVNATQRLSASVRQGRDVHHSANLGGCSLMRHDNRTAVFLDRDCLNASSGLPDNCWVKL